MVLGVEKVYSASKTIHFLAPSVVSNSYSFYFLTASLRPGDACVTFYVSVIALCVCFPLIKMQRQAGIFLKNLVSFGNPIRAGGCPILCAKL